MKDFKYMDEREVVLQKVWELFDVLRGDINSEDYSVILLLIYLRSEKIISRQLLNKKQVKQTLFQRMKNVEDVSVREVFKIFLPSIENLSERSVNKVVNLLNSIDSDWLENNIAKVFDETLERIALSQGRRGGEFIQPNQLTEFVNLYVGLTKDLNIYNPFAGVASFIKSCKDSNFVYAQELNAKTWAIGKLRLIVYKSAVDYKCEDSIGNWPTQQKFDLIVSNPPFSFRLNNFYRKQYPEFRSAEDFLLGMSMESLSDKGKLIAVLPKGLLFRGGSERRLRERLIQEDLIDTIISFPGGIMHHAGIPFIVLVLNRAKSSPGQIKLVDASSFITKPSPRENNIQVESLLNGIRLNKDTETTRLISNQDVIANDFNLNIPRYFQDDVDGVKLKDILSFNRGNRNDLPENGNLIRIRDLKDDKIDFELDIDEVEETPLNRVGICRIESSCLLLAIRWKTLKPTYFKFEKEPIYIGSDILTFNVDESLVDIAYLINELEANYVKQQIDGFRLGATIPFIRRDDLLEVKIKLPSIAEQLAKVSGLKEISDKIQQLRSERNALAHGLSTKEFNEFASLKHTLGRPRQNILGWSKNLSKFFVSKKEVISTLNDEFKEIFDLSIIDAISEINSDIKFISDVLEKGENGLLLKDYKRSIISLAEINRLINNISSNEFKFLVEKQLLKVDEMKTRGVQINKILFKTLLDNLLTNANKYGFKEKSERNHVKIEVSEVDNQLIIDVRNNGLPFPKNFDREKFIAKYSTADSLNGTGLGGYDINRIAIYFDNEDWGLILNDDPIYPVIFQFSLPIKLIN